MFDGGLMIVERASLIIETITISPARGRLQIMSVSLSDFLSMSSPLQLMKQLSPPFIPLNELKWMVSPNFPGFKSKPTCQKV